MCDDVGDPTESEDQEEPLVILAKMVLTSPTVPCILFHYGLSLGPLVQDPSKICGVCPDLRNTLRHSSDLAFCRVVPALPAVKLETRALFFCRRRRIVSSFAM